MARATQMVDRQGFRLAILTHDTTFGIWCMSPQKAGTLGNLYSNAVSVHRDERKAPELRWLRMEGEMHLPFHPHRAHHAEAWKPGEPLRNAVCR